MSNSNTQRYTIAINADLNRSRTLKKLLALLFISLLGNSAFSAESIIEVIPLNYRPASEILPLLAPLLGNTAQLIDNGSNILVKTTPDRLAEIKSIVKQLDKRQTNLVITVIQSRQTSADELNAAAGIRLHAAIDDPSKSGGRIIGHIYQTQDKDADQNTQTIRTLEGVAAHIKAGNVYPRQNFSGYGYPTTTEYTEATTGFEVIPRLVGQQVILSVSPWSDKMNGRGQIETQNAQSTIRINLGEWVELGGIGETNNSSSNSALVNTRQVGESRMHILVKVDRVN
jgi:type II secretory pathway component GspD/PulD (secretin)